MEPRHVPFPAVALVVVVVVVAAEAALVRDSAIPAAVTMPGPSHKYYNERL